jgi:hypothetical protein
MNPRNTAFAALIFVTLYNLIFFQSGFGISAGLFFLILNIYFFLSRSTAAGNQNFGLLCSVLSITFAFLFSFRANLVVQLTDFLAAGFFSLIALFFYKYPGEVVYRILSFIGIPFLVIEKSLASLLLLLKNKDKNTPEDKDKYSPNAALLRGVVMTIPIFIILLFLLIQADPIFGKLTENLFKNIGERSIISAVLFTALLGLGLSKFIEKTTNRQELTISPGKSHELSVLTGSIIALFGVFILIQFRYLFFSVGERELGQLGITSLTYSEYVRKGFFELLIAATLSSGIILYIFKFLHHLKGKQKLLLQISSAVFTIETGLLLLSAAKRLALYADAHGLTRARVFGFILLLWLAVILAIFLIRVFKQMKEKEFFAGTALATLMLLALINVINVDGLIAEKYKPTVNGEIDYYYLSNLSADASGVWRESISDAERLVNQLEGLNELNIEDNRKLYWVYSTIKELNFKTGHLEVKYNNLKWQEFNFSEYTAWREVEKNQTIYNQIPDLLSRIEKLNIKISEEVRRNTRLDRSIDPPFLR